MKKQLFRSGGVLLGSAALALAKGETTSDLKKELDAMRGEYEKRIDRLESRIRELETDEPPTPNVRKKRVPVAAADPELDAAKKREAQNLEALRNAKRATDQRFEENTETRDIAKHRLGDDELSKRIESVLGGYIDITGYFRAGYGRSDEGGPQRAFGIPGVAKYRLGNETENYGELGFAKTFYPAGFFSGKEVDPNSPVARMVYRLSFVNPYDDYGSASDTDFASPEIWGAVGNVIPGVPEAEVWAGNRFYRRNDIHINDFYFWDMSGGGAGIEDIPLACGKLAFAWIGDGAESAIYSQIFAPDPVNVAGFSKTNFDLRWYDWPFFGGKGEVGLIYSRVSSGKDSLGRVAEDSEGVSINLVRTREGFWDEKSLHKTSLQFGTGPAKTFTSGFETFNNEFGNFIRPDPNESWRFRATEQVVLKPCEQMSVGGALVYQYTDFGDEAPNQQWVSGGVRPIWHITEAFNIAFEGGVDWVTKTEQGDGGVLGKLTLAPQISLGDDFFSRPVLRAFVTYAVWDDNLKGQVGGVDYSDRGSGWSWGVQMETWW